MRRIMVLENIGPALRDVRNRITEAAEKRSEGIPKLLPRLVAVTKTKPIEYILEAYKHGQRNFGESYVQELVTKASDPRLRYLTGLRWHFIGHLQRNKCNNLAGVPNLFMVETVDSLRLSTTLNNSWGKEPHREPLKVMVEVNTSDEKSKKGCRIEECVPLAEHVYNKCPHLRLSGLMTIGEYNYDWHKYGPNPDFLCLIKFRESVCEKLSLPLERFELSMGMSSDYSQAVLMGSTNVRVGSTIFGSREPKQPPVTDPQSNSTESSANNKKEVEPPEEKPSLRNGSVDMINDSKDLVSGIDELALSS